MVIERYICKCIMEKYIHTQFMAVKHILIIYNEGIG